TYHAQPLSPQLQANMPAPLTSTDLAVGLGHSAGQHDRSAQGVFGHGTCVQAAAVNQGYAAFAQRLGIDVVQACAQPSNHAKRWSRSQQIPVYDRVVSDDQALGAGNLALQVVAA